MASRIGLFRSSSMYSLCTYIINTYIPTLTYDDFIHFLHYLPPRVGSSSSSSSPLR